MTGRSAKAEEILDVAERLARSGGYGAFSFREIARAVGIKSASVHYHFPTKEDLGEALVARYTDAFLEQLGDPADPNLRPQDKVERYVAGFRRALQDDRLMCLCGLFGAEISVLPNRVASQTRTFYERSRDWLATALADDSRYPDEPARDRAALALIARLEGAMILARSLGDDTMFDQALGDFT